MLNSFLLIILLILISAFFSSSEIALAASRKMKLKQMVDEGNIKAAHVMKLMERPGFFFTVVQIGVNAVAILGGIVGDAAFSPFLTELFSQFLSPAAAKKLAFGCSFTIVTALFILFADLVPKRLGMIAPEKIAIMTIEPMRFCLFMFRPFVWFFNGCADLIFKLLNLPMVRNDDLTTDEIYAVVEAGAVSGALRKQEHELIENVFELDSRTVPSAMTVREDVIYFDIDETEDEIKNKIANTPHSRFIVCNGSIDQFVGYVDSKDLLNRVLNGQNLTLKNGVQIHNALIIPDTLTLSEVLESFKIAGEDFAIILNEYALVVGIITLRDVMTTLMGDIISLGEEEQIVSRDENSWLIDGATPIDDVMRSLDIDDFPHSDNYETIGGFMMYMLRKIPKRTDAVKHAGYKFEVVDIDNYKIDQLLVTKLGMSKNASAQIKAEIEKEKEVEKEKERDKEREKQQLIEDTEIDNINEIHESIAETPSTKNIE